MSLIDLAFPVTGIGHLAPQEKPESAHPAILISHIWFRIIRPGLAPWRCETQSVDDTEPAHHGVDRRCRTADGRRDRASPQASPRFGVTLLSDWPPPK